MKALLTWTKRLLLTATIAGLLATNVLTLTSAAFNTAVSGLLASTLGVRTVSGALQSKVAAQKTALQKHRAAAVQRKAAARHFGRRLASRTKRVAAKSIAAIPAESIPVIGVAVVIAGTSYELYAACETVRDLDRLYAGLGVTGENNDDAMRQVCNPSLPDADAVLNGVVDKVDFWWREVVKAV